MALFTFGEQWYYNNEIQHLFANYFVKFLGFEPRPTGPSQSQIFSVLTAIYALTTELRGNWV